MLNELIQGERRAAINVMSDARSGPYSELIVNDVGFGRYFEPMRLGRLFTVSNTANQALSVANATATGIILSNPAGSGKLLVLEELFGALDVAATAMGAVGLFANVNPLAAATTHTTPLTPQTCALGGTATAVGKVDSAATLPATPILIRSLLGVYWITANTAVANLSFKDEVAGAIGIIPGCAVSIQAQTTAVTGIFGITWSETEWPL